MGQIVMSQMQIFNKHLNTKKYRTLGKNFYKILKKTIWVKPYCPRYNCFLKLLNTKKYISFRLTFLLDLEKTIYEILERTIGVKSFFLSASMICQIKSHHQLAYLQMILMFIGESETHLTANCFKKI